MVGFRAPSEIRMGIDKAVAEGSESTSRSEMIRRIVTGWLRERGYLPKGSNDG
jgi:hypothetical protein